MYDFPSIKILK